VWEVDPLACPDCGGEMRFISFITETAVIRKILEHFNTGRENGCLSLHLSSTDLAGWEVFKFLYLPHEKRQALLFFF